jgi:hypothetical protein
MGEIRLLGRAIHWLRFLGPIPVLLVLLPLVDFRLNLGPPHPWGTPILTSLVVFVAMLLVFRSAVPSRKRANVVFTMLISCASAAGYIALSGLFIAERVMAGETQRVVLGFWLVPDLEEQVQDDTTREIARQEKERNPVSKLESPDLFVRPAPDPQSLKLAKTQEEIRQEAVDELVGRTGDPSTPYAAWSRDVMALALLALWELTFAGVAAAIALLAPMPEAAKAR